MFNNISYYTDWREQQERQDITDHRANLRRYINFEIYEALFRTFCRNPNIEHDCLLRADFESFNKGITFWYNKKENLPLANLIYNYFGKGRLNHLVTFSEFIVFIREIQVQVKTSGNANIMIFRMLSEHNNELDILKIVRNYVTTPKDSPFSLEIRILMDNYIKCSLANRKESDTNRNYPTYTYDVGMYQDLIPKSSLA
jgi:hypothetical protein